MDEEREFGGFGRGGGFSDATTSRDCFLVIWRLFSSYPDLRDGAGVEVKKDRYGVFQSTVLVTRLQKDTGLGTRMWPRGCPLHGGKAGEDVC